MHDHWFNYALQFIIIFQAYHVMRDKGAFIESDRFPFGVGVHIRHFCVCNVDIMVTIVMWYVITQYNIHHRIRHQFPHQCCSSTSDYNSHKACSDQNRNDRISRVRFN